MFQSESFVAFVKELPEKAYWQAMEASAQQKAEDLKAANTHSDTMQQLHDEYIEKLYALIGKTKIKTYLSLHDKRVETLKAAQEKALYTPEGFKLLEAERKRVVEESKKIIKRSGVDLKALKDIQDEYYHQAVAAFRETIGRGVIHDPNKSMSGKNEDFFPPYNAGTSGMFAWYRVGNPPTPVFSHSESNDGLVDSQSSIQLQNAGNGEMAGVTCRTAIRQWFRMPSRGQVRARARIEGVFASNSGSIVDECGQSRVSVKQDTNVYYQVVAPSVSSRVYSLLGYENWNLLLESPNLTDPRRRGELSFPWNMPGLATGQIYDSPAYFSSQSYVVIPGVIEAGTWIIVEIGIETYNCFLSDNYTVNSNVTGKYWIKQIGLASTG